MRMKDANEREIHWYDEAAAMKEISEASGNREATKCDLIENTLSGAVISHDQTIPNNEDSLTSLKEDSEMNYISPCDHEDVAVQAGELSDLCKEEPHDEFDHHDCSCEHHDMADTPNGSENEEHKTSTDDQCVHSDALKLGKTVKINRVTPFRYSDHESGDLLIDLTDNQNGDQKDYTKLKKQDDKASYCNSFIEEVGISQERFTTDLPRHNWLVKRLKQQNQLNEGDISPVNTSPTEKMKENKPRDLGSIPPPLCPSNTEFKPIDVAKLTPDSVQKSFDLTPVGSTPSTESEPDTSDDSAHDTITPRSPLSSVDMEQASVTIAICSPTTLTKETNSSPPSPTKCTDQVTPRSPIPNPLVTVSLVKSNSEIETKPSIATSPQGEPSPSLESRRCPPPLSGIAMSSLKYDALSRFNSLPKQHLPSPFYPSPHSGESYPALPHNDVRNVRDISRSHPHHLPESYKVEQDVYGLNHRVRPSLTPLSASKDRLTFRNQIMEKSTSMIKSYDSIATANLAPSPDVLKRNAAMQRQLENQKRWIAEHEPYKLSTAPNAGLYGDHSEVAGVQAVPSPLHPTGIPLTRFPPYRTEAANNFNIDPASLIQSQEYLKEKIELCNKEIREIQQQKDILFARQQGMIGTDSPAHLSIIALNRKLSALEDYRMKQSAFLMKFQSSHYDERVPAGLKKPYMTVNGTGLPLDADELAAKQRASSGDMSENLLLRQLQTKHDEGSSIVSKTTDSVCRTIDLSKSSEKFYNDIQMQSLRVTQPTTPMNSIAVKDYLNTGDVPPLVSAERLSPATSTFPPRKSPLSPPEYPHGQPHPYSQPADIVRPSTLSSSSQLTEAHQRSHDMMHSYKSQETNLIGRDHPTIPRDLSQHLQYQKMARAREIQHSMQVQEIARSQHEALHGAQYHERHLARSHSLGPHDLGSGRPHTISHPDIKREIPYPQMQGGDPLHNHYSPGSLPQPHSYHDLSYEDIRNRQYAKENLLKRHSTEPARPGQLKLPRTSQNIMHQLHTSQMDRNFPKVLQYNGNMARTENKYSPSAIPPASMGKEPSPISPYQRGTYNRHDSLPLPNVPNSISSYDVAQAGQGAVTPSFLSTDRKPFKVRTCNACDKESQFLCSGCRGIWYCSRQCQLDDWKIHSKSCRKK